MSGRTVLTRFAIAAAVILITGAGGWFLMTWPPLQAPPPETDGFGWIILWSILLMIIANLIYWSKAEGGFPAYALLTMAALSPLTILSWLSGGSGEALALGMAGYGLFVLAPCYAFNKEGIFLVVFALLFLILYLLYGGQAQAQERESLPPSCDFYLTQLVDTRMMRGETVFRTFKRADPEAVAAFEAQGAYVFSRGGDGVVLAGPAEAIGALAGSYESRDPVEADYRTVGLKVRFRDEGERALILALMQDPTIPGNCSVEPGVCIGPFFDLAGQCLDDLGYENVPAD